MNEQIRDRRLIIIGAGGSGVEALQTARRMNCWVIVGFADDRAELKGQLVDGLIVLGGTEEVVERYSGQAIRFHVAVGSNRDRMRLASDYEAKDFIAATLVDTSAYVAVSATLLEGACIAPLAFVGPFSKVGRHAMVNVGSSVGHHATLDDFSQACPGARISGYGRLGKGAFVGSNGVVGPGVKVGEWATVGAASFANIDVPAGFSAVGVPARMLGMPKH